MGHPMGGMEDFMTIIMGLPGPMAPGMHGELKQQNCVQPAIEFATKIRDMADDFIREFGKECDTEECEPSELQGSSKERNQDSKKEQEKEDPSEADGRSESW